MENSSTEQTNITRLALITITGVLILAGAVYAAYRYSQRQTSDIILPGGVTYLGPSPAPEKKDQPPTAPLRFTVDPDVAWKPYIGKNHNFSFSYPSTLPLVIFPQDLTDSVAIAWGNIPPQQNILLNIEFIEKRDARFVAIPKNEYVKNWYKFFSGLKGVAKVEPFTNTRGMKGYKASYLNYADQAPNTDVFFEVPNDPKIMIHLANGILDPTVFNRILDTLKWIEPTSSS